MRTVYVNEWAAQISFGCGFWPVMKCPIQKWAKQNEMSCKKTSEGVFDRALFLDTKPENRNEVIKQVQDICNKCKFGKTEYTR